MNHTTAEARKVSNYLGNFVWTERSDLFNKPRATESCRMEIGSQKIIRFVNEFWTSKQRQASSLHEISYRACFKPQLPRFFIQLLTKPGDVVYDPFAGRGTTAIETALMDRKVISNDVNPLSRIFCEARLHLPDLPSLVERLREIPNRESLRSDIDLSMFFAKETLCEILSLREYLNRRKASGKEDWLDQWIRMVATNRLTGHSRGFFSVYTLPPNQAASPKSQLQINRKRGQRPDYRDTRQIIVRKSEQLLSSLTPLEKDRLRTVSEKALFLTKPSRETKEIPDQCVNLTVTSPPFLDVVQYEKDNWLRCWFNQIDVTEVGQKITVAKAIDGWASMVKETFIELYRITKPGGWVAFEVGEIRNKTLHLDETVIPLGCEAGFHCVGVLVNQQRFTKTSNIWGISNNSKGTNTNRVVLFQKQEGITCPRGTG